MSILPLLPILCACENLVWKVFLWGGGGGEEGGGGGLCAAKSGFYGEFGHFRPSQFSHCGE